MADLEEIMAGGGGSTPEADQTQTHEQPAADPNPGQPQPEQQPNPQGGAEDEDNSIEGLHKARDAERAKSRKYKEELAEVRQRLQGFEAQFQGFMQAFQAQQQPRPQPQQAQPPVEIWDDPNAFVGTQVQQALSPVQEALMFNAKLVAESRHTPEKVNEAEQAFLAAVNSRSLHPSEYEAVVNSPNRYHAAVEWFNNRPEAQRERLEAEILAKYGIQPGQQPQAAPQPQPAPNPQAMPTSFAAARNNGPRTTPQWSGPVPLSDIMKR